MRIMNLFSLIIAIIIAASPLYAQYSGGNGSQNNPYQIANLKDLIELRDKVNNGNTYKNTHFLMTGDIDLSSIGNWLPIGDTAKSFRGTFDGGNYTVSNLNADKIMQNNFGYFGLFGKIDSSGTVLNLNIGSGKVYIYSKSNAIFYKELGMFAGAVTAFNSGTIRNCTTNVDIVITFDNMSGTMHYIGGIAGVNGLESIKYISDFEGDMIVNRNALIEDCYNYGSVRNETEAITGNGLEMGGITGGSYGKIINSKNSGEIFSANAFSCSIGGIVGEANNDVIHCVNTGNIAIAAEKTDTMQVPLFNNREAGGIVGHISAHITGCYNTGKISTSVKYSTIGGIGGTMFYGQVNNCYNTGSATATIDSSICGGIIGIGISRSCIVINNCYNTGSITSMHNAAGIINTYENEGRYNWPFHLIINNCYNIGKIQGENIGGILGGKRSECFINNSYYLEGTAPNGVGDGNNEGTLPKPVDEMNTAEFVTILNNNQIPEPWEYDLTHAANSGYPILNLENIVELDVANAVRITASADTGGNISPAGEITSSLCEPTPTTFTMQPSLCYEIADVLVNGVSVGAVDTYTFPAGKSGTIHVTFKSGAASNNYTIHASATPYRGNVPVRKNHVYEIGVKPNPKLRIKLHTNAHEVYLPEATELKVSFDYCNALAWLQTKSLKLLGLKDWTVIDTVLTEDFNTLTSNYTITLSNPNGLSFTDSIDLFDIELLLIFPMQEIVPKILEEHYKVNIKPEISLNSTECLWIDTSKPCRIDIKPVCAADLRYINISRTPAALEYNSAENKINYSIPFDCNACLTVYNLLGEAVTSTEPTYMKSGAYEMDMINIGVASGMYLCELRIDGIPRKIITFPYIKRW